MHKVVWLMIALLMVGSNVWADDDTYVKIQEMMNDLGGPAKQKTNNGKVLKCVNGGTKKIKITSSGGGTNYSGNYNNCREYGSTRDGNVEITIGGGGVSDDSFTVRKGQPDEYYYGDQWDVSCKKDGSKCLARSGNVEFSFQEKTGKILDTYGIPNISRVAPDTYKELNKYFTKKLKPSADDNGKFYAWMVKSAQSAKSSWSFCEDGEDNDKNLCNFSPNFTAAKRIIIAYNSGRLNELVVKYLIQTKYNELEKKLFLSNGKETFIDLARWCAYAPCADEDSIVATTTAGLPIERNMMQSLDLLFDLRHFSNADKVGRGTLTDFSGKAVEDADEPQMYKTALNKISDYMSYQLEDIEKAKALKGPAVDNYLTDWSPTAVAVIAKKLNSKYKLPLDKAYYVAAMSFDGLYKNTIRTGGNLRHIKFGSKFEITEIGDRARMILPVRIEDKFIPTTEIDGWVNEIETDVQLKLEAELKANPKSALALEQIGFIYIHKGNYEKGTQFFQQAVEADPGNSDLLYDFAWVEKNQGKVNEALAKLDKCIAMKADEPEYYYSAGLLCITDLHDKSRAELYFRKFVELEKTGDRFEYAKTVLGGK